MINRLLLIMFLLLGYSVIQAQNTLNKGEVFPKVFHDTIPFEFIEGKIVIEVEIGNKRRKFILDTGAPCAVFEGLHQELKAKVSHKDTIEDAVGGVVELDHTRLKSFKIGQLKFRNIPAVVMSEQVGSFLKCWEIDGLIGSNALRNSILQISLRDKYLILTNEPGKLDLANRTTVPLHLDEHQSHPFLELTLGTDEVVLANFDTGNPEAFDISKEDAAILLERKSAHLIDVGYGKMSVSVTDSQQDQWFRLFTYDTLSIGTTQFMNFTSVPSAEQDYSYVGIGLGAYGILTLDYPNGQFHFQAYDKTQIIKAETYQIDQGFTIHPADDGYMIGMVWENSPAARLGLKSGYKIHYIEGVDFSKRTLELDCELIMGRIYTQNDVINLKYVDEQGKIVAVSIGLE